MKHQLQQIREAMESADEYQAENYRDYEGPRPVIAKALTALSELEPVAWKHDCAALLANDVELWIDNCPHCGRPRAAPPAKQPQYEAGDMASAAAQGFRDGVASVAQQPQAEAVPTIYVSKGQLDNLKPDPEDTSGTYLPVRKSPKGKFTHPLFAAPKQAEPFSYATQLQIAYIKGLGDGAQQAQRPDFQDEWTGYLKDGETPFERFMRERKDLNALTKLYQRALEENERLKAQQPQAEPFGYVSQHTNGSWEFSPTAAGVYPRHSQVDHCCLHEAAAD